MVTETKNKNWFARHWVISIFLGLIVLGIIGNIFDSEEENKGITGNVVNEQVEQINQNLQVEEKQEEVKICIPDWKCSEWTSCFNSKQERVCVDKNDCESSQNKPSESQTCIDTTQEIKTETDQDSSPDSSWLDSFNEAMEDLEESLEDLEVQSNIYKKIDECTELSAGESINIPAIKNEFYMVCYEIYYYAGEEALDEYIAELKQK